MKVNEIKDYIELTKKIINDKNCVGGGYSCLQCPFNIKENSNCVFDVLNGEYEGDEQFSQPDLVIAKLTLNRLESML